MAIKIVKPGVLPETRVFDATCNYCKCTFTFQPPDAQFVGDQRDGDCYRIGCPTCGRDVYRSAKQ